MNNHVIISCAVTGGDDVAGKYPNVPVTPKEIAAAAIDAEKAGAAIAHIHVRNPETGKPSMETALYREVVERIRDSGSAVIINLTTGPGARFLPSDDTVNGAKPGSNLRPPRERVQHIVELRPEICSLDMGSLNFGKGALINVPNHIEEIAAGIKAAGVKPELEVFDSGHRARRAVGRAGDDRGDGGDENPVAAQREMGRFRHLALGISDGRASGAVGRPRPRRHRGQSLSRERGAGAEQRGAGRESAGYHRDARRTDRFGR